MSNLEINNCCEASWDEICNGALAQYEAVSRACCNWCSTIPKAVEFYRKYGNPKYKELATSYNSAMAKLLDRLDYVMATPQDEDVRKEEMRAIVYEWRQLRQ